MTRCFSGREQGYQGTGTGGWGKAEKVSGFLKILPEKTQAGYWIFFVF